MPLQQQRRRVPPDCWALFDQAVETLLGLGYGHADVRITVSAAEGGPEFSFSGNPRRGPPREEDPVEQDQPPRPEGIPPHWKWLSPAGAKVMEALRAGPAAWHTADELARLCGHEKATPEFRGMLGDLAERGMIELAQGKGCRFRG